MNSGTSETGPAPKPRDPALDVAKALGIVAIVVGHSKAPFSGYLYLFHVNLFVFLSGLFHGGRRDLTAFVRARILQLYVPFVVFGLVFLAFHNLFHSLDFDPGRFSLARSLLQCGRIALFSLGTEEPLLGALWFLKVLFIVSCLHRLVEKVLSRGWHLLAAWCVAEVAIAQILLRHSADFPLLRVNVVAPALLYPFYATGAIIASLGRDRFLSGIARYSAAWPIGALLLVPLAWMGPNDVTAPVTLPFPLFYLAGFLGVATVIALSIQISRIPPVARILVGVGRKSLEVMALEFLAFKVPVAMALLAGVAPVGTKLSDVRGMGGDWGWIACSAFGVVLPLFFPSPRSLVDRILGIYRLARFGSSGRTGGSPERPL